jgi:hypothetical protein
MIPYTNTKYEKEDTKMSSIRLTPYNVQQYVGYTIVFTHNNYEIIRQIKRVSTGRKRVIIDYPPLQNNLEIMSRNIKIIL